MRDLMTLILVLYASERPPEDTSRGSRDFSLGRAQEISPVRRTSGQERYFDVLHEAGLPD
jgi:hypothetical protein